MSCLSFAWGQMTAVLCFYLILRLGRPVPRQNLAQLTQSSGRGAGELPSACSLPDRDGAGCTNRQDPVSSVLPFPHRLPLAQLLCCVFPVLTEVCFPTMPGISLVTMQFSPFILKALILQMRTFSEEDFWCILNNLGLQLISNSAKPLERQESRRRSVHTREGEKKSDECRNLK